MDDTISVYRIEEFSEFLCGQNLQKNLQLFAQLFEGGRQHISFQVLNSNSYVQTDSIAFTSELLLWDNTISRDDHIADCNDSSVFFGRVQYPLVPQDFTVLEHMYNGQLQELAHDLVEGIRNNFVAIIVFLMTVLLTDSIDFDSFTQADVSSNIVAVCGIFTLVSLLYLIVTVIAGNTKWGDEEY